VSFLGIWSPLYRPSFRHEYGYNHIGSEKDSPKPTPSRVDSSGLCPTYALPGRILRGPFWSCWCALLLLGLPVLVRVGWVGSFLPLPSIALAQDIALFRPLGAEYRTLYLACWVPGSTGLGHQVLRMVSRCIGMVAICLDMVYLGL